MLIMDIINERYMHLTHKVHFEISYQQLKVASCSTG